MTATATTATAAPSGPAPGRRVWIIERDGTHTPGILVRRGSVWPGACRVRRAGASHDELWERRNVIDHASGERLS